MVYEQDVEWLPLPRTPARSITIQDLLPHSTYNVSVRAVNDAGPGEASFTMQTTLELGECVRNTLQEAIKGIVCDCGNIFLWHESEVIYYYVR